MTSLPNLGYLYCVYLFPDTPAACSKMVQLATMKYEEVAPTRKLRKQRHHRESMSFDHPSSCDFHVFHFRRIAFEYTRSYIRNVENSHTKG